MTLLEVPDAFAQWAHVPSRLMFEGSDRRQPRLSICIPTFRRLDTLVEAVRSAIAQDWNESFEVIVVDNDSESAGADALLAAIPELATANFRYFVNAENVGMFGNWNRSIELARGEWHTMLHDDDLFEPYFASRIMTVLDRNASIDGVISRRMLFGPAAPPPRRGLAQVAHRLGVRLRFRGKMTRQYKAGRFFWSATSPVGLVARKRDILALGGYQPDEWPSSDYYFQLRFAIRYRLFELRASLVRIRADVNESFNPQTALSIVVGAHVLRTRMAGTVVPRWWGRMSPLILERQRQHSLSAFGVTRKEIEEATGVALPRDRPALYIAMVGLFGGY